MQLGTGRGALVEIFPDASAETVWSSLNESIFGLAVQNGRVVFTTDSNGRIFELEANPDGGKLTILTETHEALATRLLVGDQGLYAATSNVAKLFRIGSGHSGEGVYESPVKDAKFISHSGSSGLAGRRSGGLHHALLHPLGELRTP